MAPLPLAFAVVVALVASFAVCWLLIQTGPRDEPTETRKAHAAPTPTSGGLGIAAGFACGVIVAINAQGGLVPAADWVKQLAPLSAAALALLVIGFVDDVRDVPARLKFLLFALVAYVGATSVGAVTSMPISAEVDLALPAALGLFGAALWIFTLVNAVNFIDGANGLAMGSMAIALAAIGAIAAVEQMPALLAASVCSIGAIAGFLIWNFPAGRLFAGDAGALSVGAVCAVGSLILVERAGVSPFVPPILFFPVLADVLLTMLWRVIRGRVLLQAHAEHHYQIAFRAWGGHTPVTLVFWAAMGVCGLIGFAVAQNPDPRVAWMTLAALALLSLAASAVARLRFPHHGDAGQQRRA